MIASCSNGAQHPSGLLLKKNIRFAAQPLLALGTITHILLSLIHLPDSCVSPTQCSSSDVTSLPAWTICFIAGLWLSAFIVSCALYFSMGSFREHKKLQRLSMMSTFLFSCVSTGVIPKGLRLHFNLANLHSHSDLQLDILNILNSASSRILDLLLTHCNQEVAALEDKLLDSSALSVDEINAINLQSRKHKTSLNSKLDALTSQKPNYPLIFPSALQGSIKISSCSYSRAPPNHTSASSQTCHPRNPFPCTLRPSSWKPFPCSLRPRVRPHRLHRSPPHSHPSLSSYSPGVSDDSSSAAWSRSATPEGSRSPSPRNFSFSNPLTTDPTDVTSQPTSSANHANSSHTFPPLNNTSPPSPSVSDPLIEPPDLLLMDPCPVDSVPLPDSRDPINLTTDFTISEPLKSLCHLGPKFCPTPTLPVNDLNNYLSFLSFCESVRWIYFWSHRKDQSSDEGFSSFPWTPRTTNKAPNASPHIEAFLSQCKRDLLNPDSRRRIKDNLSPDQRNALKEAKKLPSKGIRIRLQDKGQRFVFVNSVDEDRLVLDSHLLDTSSYQELDSDPLPSFISNIKDWATTHLRAGNISDHMATFVSNIDHCHAARPKPLYKTHKTRLPSPPHYPARLLIAGCGTPTHPISSLVQNSIQHLVHSLEHRRGNTIQVLDEIIRWNNELSPLPPQAKILFCDVVAMYPSVDNNEAIAEVDRRLISEPSTIPGIKPPAIIDALKICREQAVVSFKGRNFVQSSGCGMGPPDSCDFSDIWMSGPITDRIVSLSPIPIHGFGFYRDDGLGIIQDESQASLFIDHLNSIHPNLKFETKVEASGEYLDLFLYIKDGRLHSRPFSKPTSTHIYLHPSSCHDPSVFNGLYKGVGQRLRLNTSEDHLLEQFLAEYAGYFQRSGHCFHKALEGLRLGANLQGPNNLPECRESFIKRKAASHRNSASKKRCRTSSKAFWISTYDPRVLHPRKIISKNYHILNNDPEAAELFPRKNLVAASRRLKNLSELISPTVPSDLKPDPPKKKPDLDPGSFQCHKRRDGGGCDLCSHLIEGRQVQSVVNNRKFTIQHHLSHDISDIWLIYLITDTVCGKQYIGSSTDMRKRFANHKSSCNARSSTVTGLAAHFSNPPGCPGYNYPKQPHIKVTLVDGFQASHSDLTKKGHDFRVKNCHCIFCNKLNRLENEWIMKMGLFQGPLGLNSREDLGSNFRVRF